MAGSITISSSKNGKTPVGISIGSDWYSRVVDGARQYFPKGLERYIEDIFGKGDEGGEDWADLTEVSQEGFNAFYSAIRRSMEVQVKQLFESEGQQRPTPFGTMTDAEIVEKLEADPRFDPTARPLG